jgi:hypothetical protein
VAAPRGGPAHRTADLRDGIGFSGGRQCRAERGDLRSSGARTGDSFPGGWSVCRIAGAWLVTVPPAGNGTVRSAPSWRVSRSGGAACHERVAVYLERAGLVRALGAAEGVDRLAGYDVGEAAVLQHLLPARTGQPAGYSTGPQVDVA